MRSLASIVLAALVVGFVRADEPPEKARPLRVLLVSSAAGREYQFLRAGLQREAEGRKVACSLVLLGLDDKKRVVEFGPDKVATVFPDRFDPAAKDEDPEKARFNLAAYDVVVAIDPDWTKLSGEQQTFLRKWVEKGGGLVVVAGEVHTPALASPAKRAAVKTVVDLYPVKLDDARLHALDRVPSQPRRLTFTEAAGKEKWLRLGDEEGLKGWDRHFGKETEGVSQRGFYQAYPVAKVEPGATVLATWHKETPFLVQAKRGEGRVVYVGGPELWRIRQTKAEWHEQLWLGLIRSVAGK